MLLFVAVAVVVGGGVGGVVVGGVVVGCGVAVLAVIAAV